MWGAAEVLHGAVVLDTVLVLVTRPGQPDGQVVTRLQTGGTFPGDLTPTAVDSEHTARAVDSLRV